MTRPEGRVVSVTELYSDVAHARVAYRLLDTNDGEVAAWEHVYVLRRTDRWRVVFSIADGEMAAWGERAAAFGSEA